ncbi:MAG TPA: N-acetylmuramoyl-L-alanine amidase [Candidatus Aminicenantes bacterium]|nr:N-acetylmuramoyl-L-alanine amidase [Candidatus Aminicenantes bacterium]
MMSKYKSCWLWIILFFSLIFLPFPSHPDSRMEIHNLRYHTHPSYTRIVVDIGKLREYVFSELPSPDRVYIDIYQAKLNPILHSKIFLVENDYLKQIRIAQKTFSTVRVVADLDLKKAYYRVWHLPDPFRIIIDIFPSKRPRLPQPAKPAKSGSSIIRQLGLGIQRVVIDPGHGGKDPGCVAKSGLLEKKIVLDVSTRLKKILESKENLEVIMTRESDIYLDPESRTVIANQKQADLFISIHANANRSRKLSGIETFYLNFSQDPSVIETAARENATSTKNISAMKDIIEKIVQNSKIVESKELAESIQNSLVKNLSQKYSNVKSLGVKGGPFWVLIGGEMPSVLVEISHLSNPTEEKRLKNPQYRQRVAQGIYEGIKEYVNSLGKGK